MFMSPAKRPLILTSFRHHKATRLSSSFIFHHCLYHTTLSPETVLLRQLFELLWRALYELNLYSVPRTCFVKKLKIQRLVYIQMTLFTKDKTRRLEVTLFWFFGFYRIKFQKVLEKKKRKRKQEEDHCLW